MTIGDDRTREADFLAAGGPLPRFDGFPVPPQPPPHVASAPLQSQQSGGPIRVPPLAPEKVAQYSSLFEESGAQNGLLSGMKRWASPRQEVS